MAGEAKTGQLGTDSVTGAKVAADTLDLTDIGTKLTQALGVPGKGSFYLHLAGGAGAVTDTKIVTIGARIYEFSTDGVLGPGNVLVDVQGADQSFDFAITQLVAAINADASREANAVEWATNNNVTAGCNLVEKTVTGVAPALSTDQANGYVSAATLIGAATAADKTVFHGAYTITADDVTALARNNGAAVVGEVVIGSIGSTSSPAFRVTDAYDVNGVKLADNTLIYKWVQHNAALWSLVLMDPVAVLSNTNVINWMAIS